jgi:guanylate kinase
MVTAAGHEHAMIAPRFDAASSPSGAGRRRCHAGCWKPIRYRSLDLGHHAPAAAGRDRRQALPFRRRLELRPDGAECRPAQWARCSAIATARRGAPVEEALARGRDVLFDIDWQGTQRLREKVRGDRQRVRPAPSIPELERRLHRRAQDSDN